MERREFLKMAGISLVFVSGLGRWAYAAGETAGTPKAGAVKAGQGDFFFVQLSDTHWGFSNPQVNPDPTGTLPKAIELVNNLPIHPDFIVFTGDLTHTTDDDQERRKRMAGFKEVAAKLKIKNVKFLAGEHDASLDNGKAFHEFFGKSYYTFTHKGVHFIALDNVSDPGGSIGDAQLQWLSDQLKKLKKDDRIVILTHRPLFDLSPEWDWATRDGAKAIDLLMPYNNVIVFYGHIHQENHKMTGQIAHHAAQGLMYPLPAPGSVPKKAPVAWDQASPYKGLGFRRVEAQVKKPDYIVTEYPINKT
jgi:3',5'-cyclic AMP phosphodiesterase CpdA